MTKPAKPRPNTAKLLPLDDYDLIVVSFSGGKDSLACVLDLIERGVDKSKIQLWHQRIDGDEFGASFMDWPITEGYCEAVAELLDIRLMYQWKHGGFRGEMLRENERTRGVYFEAQNGETMYAAPSKQGKIATRRKFPQKSIDLSVRWCSAYLKIDVAARAITNDPDLKSAKILFITGERREESKSGKGRALYPEIERHRTHTKKRTVHQWRSVIDWTEERVWDLIAKYGINPHPCYHLGFGRCSCMACIFGDRHQWASVRALDPKRFDEILGYEKEFGCTIERKQNVEEQANDGAVFEQIASETRQATVAMIRTYPKHMIVVDDWQLPAGAGRASTCGGPI
jgi:3'-phosphoadenosine 5'-phosphosulfate sulfotransferase (PAPS reductase)/FAD synthetase